MVLVCSGCQVGVARLVDASTTTVALLAQETVKLKPPGWRPNFVELFRIIGFGSVHKAVGIPSKFVLQPVVPGR